MEDIDDTAQVGSFCRGPSRNFDLSPTLWGGTTYALAPLWTITNKATCGCRYHQSPVTTKQSPEQMILNDSNRFKRSKMSLRTGIEYATLGAECLSLNANLSDQILPPKTSWSLTRRLPGSVSHWSTAYHPSSIIPK